MKISKKFSIVLQIIISILIFYFLNSTKTFAQFLNKDATWTVQSETFGDVPVERFDDIQILKDSVINGINYSLFEFRNTLSAVREVNNKFYYKVIKHNQSQGIYDTLEHVLYDFNLIKGDSILLNLPMNSEYFKNKWVVREVDSIKIGNEFKKRIYMEIVPVHYGRGMYWIKDVGSSFGPLYFTGISEGEWETELFCYRINETNLYGKCLMIDAGKDTTFCTGQNIDLLFLGTTAKIENGIPPFSIQWECKIPKGLDAYYTASDLLNDSTILSPRLLYPLNPGEWIKFTLHVTDSENNYSKDSISIRFSIFDYLTGGGQTRFYIEKGDSILLNFSDVGIGGGISPLTYQWQPKTYLSNPDSLITWCKPDSSIHYEVVAIDSCGCVSYPELAYDIRILADTVENKPEFAPIGAEWYYNYDPDITLDDGYQKITVLRDTIIDNESCRFLQIRNIGYSYFYQNYYNYKAGNIILYEKDNIVYYYKNKQFYVLYDFTAKAGDSYHSISYMPNCSQTYKVSIDSVTFVKVDEQLLKNFHVTLNDSFQTNYIEKIGYNEYLLPQFVLGCEILTGPHYPGPLRCYSDGDIGVYSTNIVSNCDYITSSIENKIFNDLKVFPNPAEFYITISNPSNIKIKKIELIDFSGRVVQMWYANECTGNTLNIQHISPGVYLLKAETDAGVKTEKLVVQ